MPNLGKKLKLVYSISFDKKLGLRENPIINKIQDTLNDKRGWYRMGYHFEHKDKDEYNIDFEIMFVSESYIKKTCNFTGLSCADTKYNKIYINVDRWRKGSKFSQLSLDEYRTYILNHELGHILGRNHVRPGRSGTKVPVMVQQTLGIGNCKPNPWPLYWE